MVKTVVSQATAGEFESPIDYHVKTHSWLRRVSGPRSTLRVEAPQISATPFRQEYKEAQASSDNYLDLMVSWEMSRRYCKPSVPQKSEELKEALLSRANSARLNMKLG